MSIILPCGRDDFKSFSCILLKFVLHAAKNNFNNGSVILSSALMFKYFTFNRLLETEGYFRSRRALIKIILLYRLYRYV